MNYIEFKIVRLLAISLLTVNKIILKLITLKLTVI